jgi:hypothetical protein
MNAKPKFAVAALAALLIVTEAHGMRWYSPSMGRWFSRDPVQEAGGANLYAFVANDSVNYVDPFGLWKQVSGHLWKAECGDTLTSLAQKKAYGGKGANWVCLWPAAGTKDHGYPDKIMPGDVYDASNLAVPAPGATSLRISVDDQHHAGFVSVFGAMEKMSADKVAARIKAASGQGGSPISYFILAGHGGVQGNVGGVFASFDVGQVTALDEDVSFARAQQKKGPTRCYFTRDAKAIFAGCESGEVVAGSFASGLLRKGAIAWGTTEWVGFANGSLYWGYGGTTTSTHSTNQWQYAPVWKSFPGGL